MGESITLASPSDAYNFRAGELVYLDRSLRGRLRRFLRRVLWWRQHRVVVSAVDVAAGTVTLSSLRWSWRHWEWVRVP